MKVMVVISVNDVAPRYDLAMEAAIAVLEKGVIEGEPRMLVLSEPSGDELCSLAVKEVVDLVVCGGISEVHLDYLTWKKIKVIDGVIGPYPEALAAMVGKGLEPNTILAGARAKK